MKRSTRNFAICTVVSLTFTADSPLARSAEEAAAAKQTSALGQADSDCRAQPSEDVVQTKRGGETPPQAAETSPEKGNAGAASAPSPGQPIPAERALVHGVFRFTSYPVAWTVAQKTNRPILVYVTSDGCPHCVRMVEQTYKLPAVSQMVVNRFETVYVNRRQQAKLVQKMKINWFPTTIVVAPNNQVIDRIEGYVDSSVFTRRIQTQLAAHEAVLKNAQKSLVQK